MAAGARVSRRAFGRIAGAGLLCGALAGACGPPGEPDGALRLATFSCDRVRAVAGERLTLRWEYAARQGPTAQRLRFLRLHLGGIAEDVVDLAPDVRRFGFAFEGPVVVEVQGTAPAVSVSASASAAALTVHRRQDLFFTGVFRSASDTPLAPYLGYPQDGRAPVVAGEAVRVEFTQFVGFYDADGSGTIDPLGSFAPPGASFRALSLSARELLGFGFAEGSGFPRPPGAPGPVTGVVHAGAIVVDGRPVPYAAADGEGSARVSVGPSRLRADPVFVTIALVEDGARPAVADVQIGNLEQGLVATVTTSPPLIAVPSLGEAAVWADRATGLSTGVVRGGRAGVGIAPAGGAIRYDALVDFDLEWRTGYVRDTEVLGVLTTG